MRESERGRERERGQMADEAVDFLLENLNRLLIHHPDLILGNTMDQIRKLEPNLRLFEAFLRNTTTASRNQETVRDLIFRIRDAVYQAEDIIDGAVTQAVDSKTRNYFLRSSQTQETSELLTVAEYVESIGRKVRDTHVDEIQIDHFSSINIRDKKPQLFHIKDHGVVGFEDESDALMHYLTEETDHLDIISIVGMPGLGKTTLASKVFNHPAIQYAFRTRIWVCVSAEFTQKNVFLAILREFTSLTEDMYCKSDKELAQLVAAYLERGKFLIVMDDVWTAEAWDQIRIALPKSNKMGKVLITSRNAEVGRYANPNRYPHTLRFLNHDESWMLLMLLVFGETKCPPELATFGNLIVSECRGLPLTIVVIGGILANISSASDEMSATKNEWREVSESVRTYYNMDEERSLERIISLSYDELPYHLRMCFIYFGMFPEDFEIPAWKLIRMWIAEGFVQRKGGYSAEQIAERYLEDLISRNLVITDKRSLTGRVTTCRVHDVLHNFCKTKAQGENFLQEIDKSSRDGFLELYRRLCIHSHVLDFISSKPYGPRVRSFVCFSKDEISFPTENISTIPAAFKLLRVLDAEPIKFTRIPSELYQLVHLRYLALSFIKVAVLPVAFVKLWNLETLIFNTRSRTLEIKADIFVMVHLRHLKTNASATLLKKGESNTQGEKLQTLGTISPESCTEEVFERARNLKKLSVRGRLALLLHDENGSFGGLGKLDNLEKLKLLNDVFSGTLSEGQLHGLPPPYKFPPRLRSLTLSDTFLDWSHMSILGMLDNLEILKLKHKAFMGRCWEAVDGGFRHLEVLHIGRTNLVSWIASTHHFPRLRRLELRNCEELREVPLGLADIPSFQQLDLYRCKSAPASAKKIYETRRAKQSEKTAKISEFKLSIFPPED